MYTVCCEYHETIFCLIKVLVKVVFFSFVALEWLSLVCPAFLPKVFCQQQLQGFHSLFSLALKIHSLHSQNVKTEWKLWHSKNEFVVTDWRIQLHLLARKQFTRNYCCLCSSLFPYQSGNHASLQTKENTVFRMKLRLFILLQILNGCPVLCRAVN